MYVRTEEQAPMRSPNQSHQLSLVQPGYEIHYVERTPMQSHNEGFDVDGGGPGRSGAQCGRPGRSHMRERDA